MAYTVKQLASMSGVSVRTLHFYDETGLLKPARVGANGYRYYDEPELLRLQQILFYRELGFELKQIKKALTRPEFENASALQAHREVLEENINRTRALIDTIDKTLKHLKGGLNMTSEEMFAGFTVPAGKARFDEQIQLRDEPNDCKVSAKDTGGAMCAFEFTGLAGGPRHQHYEQDEWIYVVRGEIELEVNNHRQRLSQGDSIFLPRKIPHAWAALDETATTIINVYQPAGKMEDFFRQLATYKEKPVHEALRFNELKQLFRDHGMEMVGPPLLGKWHVDEEGRMIYNA